MKEQSEIMQTRERAGFSYLLFGIGLGGIIAALLARKRTRDLLRERSGQSLAYLRQKTAPLGDAAEEIVKKANQFVGPHRDRVKTDTETEKQAYQEEKRDQLGG